ncbi:response regulator [Pendulispora albinea]|uniref:Response regulator n=1 Tax=Pendulispora albinea TaxID=2741071 RepID=A0ABZ2LNE1_9BACT
MSHNPGPVSPSASPPQDPEKPKRKILERLHILVVEDDRDSRSLIARFLRQAGARVTAVADAYEALEVIRQVRPDLLLSDIAMPGMDGHALIRQVRSSPSLFGFGSLVPAIALSAYAAHDDRVSALGAGFDEHLAKPVDFAAMLATITRVVNEKRAQGERKTDRPKR